MKRIQIMVGADATDYPKLLKSLKALEMQVESVVKEWGVVNGFAPEEKFKDILNTEYVLFLNDCPAQNL